MNKVIDTQPLDPEQLTIATEKVCAIVVKARALQAKVAAVENDSSSNMVDEGARGVLEDTGDDATVQEITGFIDALDEDEIVELVALAWLGRGSFDTWDECLREARNAPHQRTAEYLLTMPHLADHLEDALSRFGEDCTDFEADYF
jgi:hypothetical protein